MTNEQLNDLRHALKLMTQTQIVLSGVLNPMQKQLTNNTDSEAMKHKIQAIYTAALSSIMSEVNNASINLINTFEI